MTRRRAVLAVGACLYAVSWFLPVLYDEGGWMDGAPGWRVFGSQVSFLWNALRRPVMFTSQFFMAPLLGIFVILLNGFLVFSMIKLARGSAPSDRTVPAGLLVVAFLLAAAPLPLMRTEWDFGPGYFLWLASFAVVALARFAGPTPEE